MPGSGIYQQAAVVAVSSNVSICCQLVARKQLSLKANHSGRGPKVTMHLVMGKSNWGKCFTEKGHNA